MKTLIRSVLVVAVAAIGSMPVQAQAGPNGRCAGHGGMRSPSARPGAGVTEVTISCDDGRFEGPSVSETR